MNTYAYIDTFFAKTLLQGEGDEEAFHILADLMKSAREGQIALYSPSIETLPLKLLEGDESPLVAYKEALYLRKNWELETKIVESLKRLVKEKAKLPPLPLKRTDLLYAAQKKAYETISTSPFLILSGGPGCGKTFLAREIIEGLLEVKKEAKIIFTAPTAKASSRLIHPKVTSKTLHSLLGLKETVDLTKEAKPITADLIIVDECSMIDSKLFSLLLSAINPEAHLILMGDPYQLPPVETISLFKDLCHIPEIPHIHLNEVKRTRSISLQTLNQAIHEGDESTVLSLLTDPSNPESVLLPLPKDIAPLLSLPGDSIILSPFNKGPFGTEMINTAIDKYTNKAKKPIIITKNDYRLGLMNGDRGYIENNTAYFHQSGETLSYPLYLLSSYELAFAISIHKSQGSEFDHVYIVLRDGSETFGKEMLYTAVTRAKLSVTLFADPTTIKKILSTESTSKTYLESRLREIL